MLHCFHSAGVRLSSIIEKLFLCFGKLDQGCRVDEGLATSLFVGVLFPFFKFKLTINIIEPYEVFKMFKKFSSLLKMFSCNF